MYNSIICVSVKAQHKVISETVWILSYKYILIDKYIWALEHELQSISHNLMMDDPCKAVPSMHGIALGACPDSQS